MNWRAMTATGARTLYPVHRMHGVILLLLLMFTLLLGMGNSLHSRMLWVGEQAWPNYYLLDPDATEPTCTLSMDVDAEVAGNGSRPVTSRTRTTFSAHRRNPEAIRKSLRKKPGTLPAATSQSMKKTRSMPRQALGVFKAVEQGLCGLPAGEHRAHQVPVYRHVCHGCGDRGTAMPTTLPCACRATGPNGV